MKKIFSTVTAALIAALLFVGSASADLIYTRQDSSYSNTALGYIPNSGSPTTLQTNIGGNNGQYIHPIKDAKGEYRVVVALHTTDQQDILNVYSPADRLADPSAWQSPKNAKSSLQNIRALAQSGGYLYGIDYDRSLVSKIRVVGDQLAEVKTWGYPNATNTSTSTAFAHGEGIVAHGGYLYAIFTRTNGKSVWTDEGKYEKSRIVKLDRDLNVITSADLEGLNVDGQSGAICLDGDDLYVVSRGGKQNTDGTYNAASRVEVVDLTKDPLEPKTLITSEAQNKNDSAWTHDFSGIAVDGTKAYIVGVNWPKDGGYNIKMYETAVDGLASGNIGASATLTETGSEGWSCAAAYDAQNKALYIGTGYKLIRWTGSKTEYSTTRLGGDIAAFSQAAPKPADYTELDIESAVKVASASVEGGSIKLTAADKIAPKEIAAAATSGDFSAINAKGNEIVDLSVINTSTYDMTAYPTGAAKITLTTAEEIKSAEDHALVALIKNNSSNKYDLFSATVNGKTITFTVDSPRDHFSENDIVIATIKTTKPIEPPKSEDSSGGGCAAGASMIALAALAMIKRKK